jgi:type I restriction enzyme S subunit
VKSGWPILPFEDVVQDCSAGNAKTLQSDYKTNGRFAVVDQGKDLIAGYVNDSSLLCQVTLPAIVFGDHTRIFKFIDFPFCMGADGTKVLRPKIRADEKFLFHYLQSLDIPEAGYSRHFKILKRTNIALPPIEEQRRLAAILDKADALRQKRRAALQKLDSLTQSIFLDMFGDPASNPKSWKQATLGDITERLTDGTHFSPPIQSSGVPYITAKHLRPDGLDFFSDPWFVTQQDHDEIYKRCDPRPGDVLYIKDGATTGVAAINRYEFPFSMLSSLALMRPSPELCLSEYLCAFLNEPRVKQIMLGDMAGAAIRRLTLEKLRRASVLLPPISLQKKFSGMVTALQRAKESAHASLDLLSEGFASLQRRAFLGEL